MSKITEIFNYMRTCPQLTDLWSIAATEDVGVRVVLPQGGSQKRQYDESIDALGDYNCEIIPFPSYYEDYHINCYQAYDAKDNSVPEDNINILSLDEVQRICDWIEEQDDNNNFPDITGEKVVSIECNPSVPQIRFINPQDNTVCYFITVRIRFVNKAKRKSITYESTD